MTRDIHAKAVITSHRATSVDGELRYRCPQCHAGMGNAGDCAGFIYSQACSCCGYELGDVDGIVHALTVERAAHFNQFMVEYQAVRASEGRGSDTSAYYLALPYKDLSGMNQSQWAIRSRTFGYLERVVLPGLEHNHASGMDVLDLGAGNGWLSYRMALLGHRPVAIDLLANNHDGLGAARHYADSLPALFPRFQAELNNLPFEGSQFDVAIFNASFHYSEDFHETLAETVRCLRSGGHIIIADTPWYSCIESGLCMLVERRALYKERFGFPSDAINSLEFVTTERLRALEREFGLEWQIHSPFYGLRWTLRPLIAKIRHRREPSRFRIYVAEVRK